MMQNEKNIRKIRGRIQRAAWLLRIAVIVPFCMVLLAAAAGAVLVYFLLDYLTALPVIPRLIITAFIPVFFLIYLPIRRRKLFRRAGSDSEAAAKLEEFALSRRPDGFKARLLSAIDFAGRSSGQTGVSVELQEKTIADAASESFNPLRIPLFDRKKMLIALGALMLASLVFGLLACFRMDLLEIFLARAVGQKREYPTRTVIESIEPVNAPEYLVEQYNDVTIRVKASGVLPRQGRLSVQTGENKNVRLVLESTGEEGVYTAVVRRPAKDFTCEAMLGDDKSSPISIRVIPPPLLMGGSVRIIPPAYTKRETVERKMGPLEVPEGATLAITAETDRAVEKCFLVLSSGAALPGTVQGKTCTFPEIPVKQNLSYRVEVEDQYAIRNRERIDYPVTAVPDRMPVILLERPENGGFYSPKRGIIYRISISDDYGVKDLDCRYEVLRRKKVGDYDRIETVSKGSLKLEEFTDIPMETKVSGTLDLKKMRLTPGCTVQLLFRVKDSHPKRRELGESEMLEVNFVTDAELQEILKQEELQIYQNLSDVVDDMKHQRTIIHNILQKEEEKKK